MTISRKTLVTILRSISANTLWHNWQAQRDAAVELLEDAQLAVLVDSLKEIGLAAKYGFNVDDSLCSNSVVMRLRSFADLIADGQI